MLKRTLLFSAVFLCRTLVRADYTIDDSNYSVLKFSENPAGPVWGPFGSDTGEVLEIRLPNGTMQTVDATQCYDGTYTYAACNTSNNCAVQFSFTGSGITVYVLQAGPQGMSASLSIDSGTATTATLGAPSSPQYYVPHVTLFDLQNIPSGTHSAMMTVLDWDGGFSGMMLDYIDVNQAEVSGPTSSTTSPSPSASPSSANPTQSLSPLTVSSSGGTQTTKQSSVGTQAASGTASVASVASVFSSYLSSGTALPSSSPSGNSTFSSASSPASKQNNLAAIVGGTVGGLGLLALLALTFLYCRRRRQQQRLQSLNERPAPLLLPQPESRFTTYDPATIDPFGSSTAIPSSEPLGTSRPCQSWTNPETGSTPNLATQDQSNVNPITNYARARAASSGDESATSFMRVSVGVPSVATPQDQESFTPAQLLSYPSEKSRAAALIQASAPPRDATAGPNNARPNVVLTDEQADFVNSLFNNNVSAPVVARVIERMVANTQGANNVGANDPELHAYLRSSQTQPSAGGWVPATSDLGDGETTVGTAPPSYDYVQAQ